jgi:hypothetical protein
VNEERYVVDKLLGKEIYFVFDTSNSKYVSDDLTKEEAYKLAEELNQTKS